MPRPNASSLSVRDLLPRIAPDMARHGVDRLLLVQAKTEREAILRPCDRRGLDFATQDYLGLTAHPGLRSAAIGALGQHRLCATGTAAHLGLTYPVLALEDRTASFLRLPHAVSFPSGSEAIRATMHALLFPRRVSFLANRAGSSPSCRPGIHGSRPPMEAWARA